MKSKSILIKDTTKSMRNFRQSTMRNRERSVENETDGRKTCQNQ